MEAGNFAIETGNRTIGNEYDTFPKELFPDYPYLAEDEVNFLYIYILEQRAYECPVITSRKKNDFVYHNNFDLTQEMELVSCSKYRLWRNNLAKKAITLFVTGVFLEKNYYIFESNC